MGVPVGCRWGGLKIEIEMDHVVRRVLRRDSTESDACMHDLGFMAMIISTPGRPYRQSIV